MNFPKEDLAKYRVKRAKEAIEEAKLLAEHGHWNTTLNRLYYAAFYMISAWLIYNDFKATSHNGVKTGFNSNLVKTGLVDLKEGELYNKLFGLRESADYRDFQEYNEKKVKPLMEDTQRFINKIEGLLHF